MMAIAAGSTRAFEAVMDSYIRDVFRFSFSIVGDSWRAEDVCQETFTRLWSSAASWTPTGRIKNWLLKIAHNLCIDELRHANRHSDVDTMAGTLHDKGKPTGFEIGQAQTATMLRAAVLALPERQRTAMMLVHYQERTNIEAADIMDISVDALESLLARGRRALKEGLKDQKDILLGE